MEYNDHNATQGLLLFKRKNYSAGRKYYRDGIEKVQTINKDQAQLALLHLAKQEILFKTNEALLIVREIQNSPFKSNSPEVVDMQARIINLYYKSDQFNGKPL